MRGGSQIDSKIQEWNIDEGITIRAAFVKDVPYAATEDIPIEHGDLWILFLSIFSNDQWIAYGAIDSLAGQPELSVKELSIGRLKKLSILIGDPWFKIQSGPMQASQKHRKLVEDVKVVNPDFESMSYLELLDRRAMADWEGITIHWAKQGIILSLN